MSAGKDEEWLDIHRLRELNNGRLAMVAITAMVVQELNTGLNLILSDEVLEMKVKARSRRWRRSAPSRR